MPIAPIWKWFSSDSEETATETIEQDEPAIPANELPVADLNASAIVEGPLDMEDSNILKVEHDEANSNNCPETGESKLLDDNQIGLGTEEMELTPCAADESTVATITDSNGENRRSSVDEDRPSSSVQDKHVATNTDRKLMMFELVTSCIGIFAPILAIVLGIENIGKCPADFYIPYLTLVKGAVGLLIVIYALAKTGPPDFVCLTEDQRNVIQILSSIFVTLWLFEVYLFSQMDASFDVSAPNYCDFSFYVINIILNTFSVLSFIVGMGLFISIPDESVDSSTLEDHMWMADF